MPCANVGARESIAWLANMLAQFDCRPKADMQIMSGSFTKQYDIKS